MWKEEKECKKSKHEAGQGSFFVSRRLLYVGKQFWEAKTERQVKIVKHK